MKCLYSILTEDVTYEDNVNTFNQIIGEWDFIQGYTGSDVVDPHIGYIQVNNNTIQVSCEIWDPDVDDYVSCDGGSFEAPEIIASLNKADFDNSFNVYEVASPIYSDISQLIDWDKVSSELFALRDKELEEENS